MKLISERIQDRHRRWWAENEDVPDKHLAEKMAGRKYAKSMGVKVPELYHQSERIESIPSFDTLPSKFVIKPSRGWSANNVFALLDGTNLLDGNDWTREEIIEHIVAQPKVNENPRTTMMVEEFLVSWDGEERIPLDYKFYMFGEKVSYIHVVERNSNTNTRLNRHWFVDENWEPIPNQIMLKQSHDENPVVIPYCSEELVWAAKLLGKNLNMFMRIDLYATKRGAVFGEFTPQPHGGRGFTEWADEWLGALWKGKEGCG